RRRCRETRSRGSRPTSARTGMRRPPADRPRASRASARWAARPRRRSLLARSDDAEQPLLHELLQGVFLRPVFRVRVAKRRRTDDLAYGPAAAAWPFATSAAAGAAAAAAGAATRAAAAAPSARSATASRAAAGRAAQRAPDGRGERGPDRSPETGAALRVNGHDDGIQERN